MQSCPEIPLFNSGYPDGVCVDGFMYNLHSYTPTLNTYTQGGKIPCPFCNRDKYIEFVQESEDYSTSQIETMVDKMYQKHSNPVGGKLIMGSVTPTTLDKNDEESVFNGRLLRTVSGLYVDVFDPKPEMFIMEDIAHGLSNTCRWGGQCKEFYSVAQHSVQTARRLTLNKYTTRQLQWAGLMHDASEAYMLDMPRPLKRELPQYKEIEGNVMYVIAKKFGFKYPMLPEIKVADNEELEYEHDRLMHKKGFINCWLPQYAYEQFLILAKELHKP